MQPVARQAVARCVAAVSIRVRSCRMGKHSTAAREVVARRLTKPCGARRVRAPRAWPHPTARPSRPGRCLRGVFRARPVPPRYGEAAGELRVGAAQRDLGVDLQVAGEVGHDEQEIAHLVLDLVLRGAVPWPPPVPAPPRRSCPRPVRSRASRSPPAPRVSAASPRASGRAAPAPRPPARRPAPWPARSAAFTVSQSRVCCSADLSRLSSPKTWGWRATILSAMAVTTSSKVKCPPLRPSACGRRLQEKIAQLALQLRPNPPARWRRRPRRPLRSCRARWRRNPVRCPRGSRFRGRAAAP
jgi:hypothetical protein